VRGVLSTDFSVVETFEVCCGGCFVFSSVFLDSLDLFLLGKKRYWDRDLRSSLGACGVLVNTLRSFGGMQCWVNTLRSFGGVRLSIDGVFFPVSNLFLQPAC
jgi:hypothetical protein